MQNKSWIAGVIFGFILSASLIYTGCKSMGSKVAPENPAPVVTSVTNDLEKDTKTLEQTTKEIKSDATDGQKKTPADVRPVLDPYWLRILFNAGQQENVVTDLKQKTDQLDKAVVEINKLKTFSEAETKRADTAEADRTSTLRRNLHLLVIVGVCGIAGAGFLIFSGGVVGSKWGIGLGVFSAILTGVSLFISQTAQLIPWIVGGVVVICIGYGIWYVLTQKKEKQAVVAENVKLNKIGKQLVATIEPLKQLLTTAGRKKMFGDGAIMGMNHMIQDDDTRRFVAKQRLSIQTAPPMPVKPTIDTNGDGVVDRNDDPTPRLKMLAATDDIWTCQLG